VHGGQAYPWGRMSEPPDFPADDPPPTPPVEPDAGDCCGEGCVPCIFDLYEEALERYRRDLAQWRQRHPDAAHFPPDRTGNR